MSGDSGGATTSPPATAVSAPTGLTGTVTADSKIHLSWDAVAGADSYRIYETNTPTGLGTVTAPSSDRGPFSDYRTYSYWVTAIAAGVESAPSAHADVAYSAPVSTGGGTTTAPSGSVTVGALTGSQSYQSTSSLPYGSLTVPGPFVATQGCWGDSAAQTIETAGPCGFKVTKSGHNKTNGVAAYPSLYHGCWPNASYQTGKVWPRKVSAINYWHASLSASTPPSKGDVAWDAWLGSSSTTHDVLELMIWTWGNVSPIGSKVATINVDGMNWDVWHGNATGTPTVSYLSQSNPISVTDLDMLAFVKDSVSRGYATSSHYLTSVQVGSEIWVGGTGFTLSGYVETVA